MSVPSQSHVGFGDKVTGSLLGTWIGDALAMPAHWYYDRLALEEDYGLITDFLAPKKEHPGSIFWRSSWEAPRPELDILGDQRPFWGQRKVHYHQNLKAGENTLTVKLAAMTWDMLTQLGSYDKNEFLDRYINLLTSPDTHRDTYLEECHRGFFTNLGKGLPPDQCGVKEIHIGGLVMMLPVAIFFAHDPERATTLALEHLSLTHPGKEMRLAAEAVLSLLLPTLNGASLTEVIREECSSQRNPHFGLPYSKWLDQEDSKIIGKRLSSACYVDQSVPATIFLAMKYAEVPEQGLVANTALGGDNVHRGGILGALLGAAHGSEAWPKRWVQGLLNPPIVQPGG